MLIHEDICVSDVYEVIGIVYVKNGCCEDRPVAITKSGGVISCQCACGGWCTNGHKTATAAVLEYRHMSRGHGCWNISKLSDKLARLENMIFDVDRWNERK